MQDIQRQKDKRSIIFMDSVYLAIGAVATKIMAPDWIPLRIGLDAAAIYGIGFYVLTTSKFNRVFKNLKLGVGVAYPLIKGERKTEYSTIYKFTLPTGLSTEQIEEKKIAIEQYLGRDVDIKYTYKEFIIEEFNEKLKSHIEYKPIILKADVPLIIGYDRKGQFVWADLSNGEAHALISGETGSGKSTVLRAIITNFILCSDVKLHLVDLKMGTEFNVFQKSNKVKTFCRTVKETESLLQELDNEVTRRYNLFYEKDVKDIKEYNKKFSKDKLSYEVLIVDEFADLHISNECKELLQGLSRKARACGVHMILSTQRPDSKVLDGAIKANITTVLGLKTLNGTNSSIILGEAGLEKLRGKGHGIFKRGEKTEIQAPFLDVDKCRELIKHTYINKKVVRMDEVENFDCIDKL